MNVKRGLLRLWVLFSAIWCLCLLGLSAPDWYHAASYWYRSRGFEVTKASNWCPSWEKPLEKEQVVVDVNAPHGYGKDPIGKPEQILTTLGLAFDCFNIIARDGSRYRVVSQSDQWNSQQMKDVALYNPEIFPPWKGAEPLRVDMWERPRRGKLSEVIAADEVADQIASNSDKRRGEFIRTSNPIDHLNLKKPIFLTGLAFLVPIAAFVLGSAVWWVATRFKA